MEHLTPNFASHNVQCTATASSCQCMLRFQFNEGTEKKATASLVTEQALKLPVTHVSYMTRYVSPFCTRNNTTAPIVSC